MKKLFYIGAAALAATLLVPLIPWSNLQAAQVFADDDDGGDDDGGGAAASGGGNSGGNATSPVRKFKKKLRAKVKSKQKQIKPRAKQKPKQRRAERAVKRPKAGLALAEPDTLIVRGLLTEQIDQLRKIGFRPITQFTEADGRFSVKFGLPSRVTLSRARNRVRALLPNNPVDYNHYFRQGYYVQSGNTCAADSCKPFELIGWTGEIATCPSIPEIGIIDTWVDDKHPALAGAQVARVELSAIAKPQKLSQHGTGVAALLVGRQSNYVSGLLPQANIVAINVFETSPKGDERTDAFHLVEALSALEKRGTKIINMSLAGPENEVLERAINDAAAGGAMIIAAAGNAGPSAAPAYPAAYDDVVAVTAVSDKLNVYRRAGRGKHIDIAAPGVHIKTAGRNNGIEIFSGSSFAVPFVTAAVALQLSSNLSATPQDVRNAIMRDAKDLGAAGHDSIFGAGLMQFKKNCAK